MDPRPFFFLILLFVTTGASVSYFSGAFAKNIANVSSIIKTIVENGDKEASNANLFLSQIIMTATDIPAEAEGSGDKPEKKTFIPMTEFRKYATEYLESVAQQKANSEFKMHIGEALRELRMENVRRKVPMDKFVEKFYGTAAVEKYNEVEEKMVEVEKNVIQFFTIKNNPGISADMDEDVALIFEKLIKLLEENQIFDLILANNRYNDDVFTKLFQHFRNHAIFLSVSTTINAIQQNRDLLNDSVLFDEHVNNVTDTYKSFLNAIIAANKRREFNGFTFENSFTASEVSGLTEFSNLPTAKNHNLFNFNWEKEDFEGKYTFLTVRRCGEKAFNTTFEIQSEVHKRHGACTTGLYRSELQNAPEIAKTVGQFLLEKSLEEFRKDTDYKWSHSLKIANHFSNDGLIAIFTNCDKSTVSDTVYEDNHIYKVAVTVAGRQSYYHDYYNTVSWKSELIEIIGYFMKPKDATY